MSDVHATPAPRNAGSRIAGSRSAGPDPAPNHWWVDGIVVLAAGALIAVEPTAVPTVGAAAAVIVAALAYPAVQLWRRSRIGPDRLYGHVPDDVADLHRRAIDAAGLDGVVRAGEFRRVADDALWDTAALLAGRPPRGGAQRRYVAARCAVLASVASDCRERHEAWNAALVEVAALATAHPADGTEVGGAGPGPGRADRDSADRDRADRDCADGDSADRESSGRATTAALVVLAPIFLWWDGVVGIRRLAVAFVDGVALRVRTLSRAVVQAAGAVARRLVAVLVGVRARWQEFRRTVGRAVVEARTRFVAGRLRMRRRVRLALRPVADGGRRPGRR